MEQEICNCFYRLKKKAMDYMARKKEHCEHVPIYDGQYLWCADCGTVLKVVVEEDVF